MAFKIDRVKYNSMFGPTVGDKIRLGDTEIFVEIEKDYTLYGEEIKFGGGKTHGVRKDFRAADRHRARGEPV